MEWKTSWGYEPIDYGKTIGWIEETACRMYVKNNLSGNRVRVRFSNRFGNTPLYFQAVPGMGMEIPGKMPARYPEYTKKSS